MWRVPVYLVTICLLVQVNASPEISLEDLLERLITLEDWKRETEKEVSMLQETVAEQGVIIKNLERDLAVQAILTATLKSCIQDKNQDEHQTEEEDENISEGKLPDNRIRATDLHNEIPVKQSSKRGIVGGVAFTAYLDHDINPGLQQTIKFNQMITNDGNAYNVHTGVFTCPEAGMYLFTFFLAERSEENAVSQLYAELVVNSQLLVVAVVETVHNTQDSQGGNTVVVRLNQGDAVWIESTGNRHHLEGSTTVRASTFTGVYLYA